MSTPQLLAAAGNLEFSIFWSNHDPVNINAYLEDRPKEHGLWMWEKGSGWRRPTNQELCAIFKNQSPFDITPVKVDREKWVAEQPRKKDERTG